MAERASAPFAAYLHFVTAPSLRRELRVPAHPACRDAQISPPGMDVTQLLSGSPEQFRQLSPIHSQLELPVGQK